MSSSNNGNPSDQGGFGNLWLFLYLLVHPYFSNLYNHIYETCTTISLKWIVSLAFGIWEYTSHDMSWEPGYLNGKLSMFFTNCSFLLVFNDIWSYFSLIVFHLLPDLLHRSCLISSPRAWYVWNLKLKRKGSSEFWPILWIFRQGCSVKWGLILLSRLLQQGRLPERTQIKHAWFSFKTLHLKFLYYIWSKMNEPLFINFKWVLAIVFEGLSIWGKDKLLLLKSNYNNKR